jgi:GT2 family glycosyltransferase
VSYRTPELVRRCLRAVLAESDSLALDVCVVDNASGDGSADLVASELAHVSDSSHFSHFSHFSQLSVRLIRNTTNVGFGAAHNQALRRASARHLLVLNSDAEPRSGALRQMVEYLDAHPDVAVVSPRLRYPSGRVQPSLRRFPTAATFFFESTQLQRFFPRSRFLQHYYMRDTLDERTSAPPPPELEVDWLAGACLCVRAAAAADVGLFDERFFLYSEEVDWCRRFRAAGWRVVYLPHVEVMHHEGASTGQDLAARDVAFQRSKLRYIAKWHGGRLAAAFRTYLVAEYVARAVEESLKLAVGSRVEERRQRLRVIAHGLRHIVRCCCS